MPPCFVVSRILVISTILRETNIIAMRLGPGKHLKGRTLMGGIVKPEEFDYFHEVTQFHCYSYNVP